ncbi:hypothetical protein LX32DRAFT_648658 [Colletotrichum zoysiae]|uniref:Uncharacterized protein n=1 Tax=Colletotrichum zoysiae TaxID=1216348 RepID=A0AAD9M9N8_9PEZI|nr:hypothetical protein LX32DRAFT_648658 [Colletotrichum zoysiae]
MRFSSYLSAAALSATAVIAAPYTWSITNWSSTPDFASFQVSAPTAKHNGVSIPAFSLTAPCKLEAKLIDDSADCSSLIANNADGRTFKVVLIGFDGVSQTMTISGTLGFKDGETNHTLDGARGQNITTS